MKIQPKYYTETIKTSYGKCINGKSGNRDYSVYVAYDKQTGDIVHKLYYISHKNRLMRAVLRFFKNNKVYNEVGTKATE